MKKLMLFMFMTSFVYISCEDDDANTCNDLIAEANALPFAEQLTEYMMSFGDSTYVQPDDWKTNCEAHVAKMQELLDNDCYTAQDSVSQADVDGMAEFCDL